MDFGERGRTERPTVSVIVSVLEKGGMLNVEGRRGPLPVDNCTHESRASLDVAQSLLTSRHWCPHWMLRYRELHKVSSGRAALARRSTRALQGVSSPACASTCSCSSRCRRKVPTGAYDPPLSAIRVQRDTNTGLSQLAPALRQDLTTSSISVITPSLST